MAVSRRYRPNFTDQVARELETAIRTQKYLPEHRLPSVEKLSLELGVGRSTVREALRTLQAKGLVEVVHGRGTFVKGQRLARSDGNLNSFTEIVRGRGMKPTSHILHSGVTRADARTAARLLIAAGDRVIILKRLRLADDVPMSVETTIIPHARFSDLLDYPWLPQTSLYAVFEERYQVIPKTADQTIRSVLAAPKESALLNIEPKSPLLLVETVTYDQHGLPIEFGQFLYCADRYEYQVRLRRE